MDIARWIRACVAALPVFLCTPTRAIADQLAVEQLEGERGYVGVEELSYEAVIVASSGFSTQLELRVALHNSSQSPRDVVHTLALPRSARITKLAVARDGIWRSADATHVSFGKGVRVPGSVYVREISPANQTELRAAELVAFGLAPQSTVVVELGLEVYPRLTGKRWMLDLPARGVAGQGLARDRRIIVRGLGPGEQFHVGDVPNTGPFMLTRSEDAVTVSWPTKQFSQHTLDGLAEARPVASPRGAGELRLYLRLGTGTPAKPDHVVFLIDRSRSTSASLDRGVEQLLDGLAAALPPSVTLDLLTFHREVAPAAVSQRWGAAGDPQARAALIQRLRATPRGQGTDIGAGLLAAARAVGQRGATRPLVVVVTDGMLPSETTPERIRDQLERQLGRRFGSTEFLFVVDEPMIGNSGLPIDHPISELAAALGARLSLESLAGTEAQAARLLAAPKMLGELRVDAPDNVTLTAEVPKGLTAGGFAVVTATYERRPPRSLRVRGRIAGRGIVRVVPVQRKAAQPEALATVTEGDLEPVLQSGFVQPAWYRPADERTARQSIKLASYRGVIRRGFLDAPIFRYYLNTRVLPRARACYNKSLSRHADQTGRVVLEMEIGKGEVMFARAVAPQLRHPDAKLVDCLREAAWQLEIPAGTLDDQVYQLRYPLRLHPPKKRTAAGALEIDEEFLRFLLAQPSP